jgi:hypothetical protein
MANFSEVLLNHFRLSIEFGMKFSNDCFSLGDAIWSSFFVGESGYVVVTTKHGVS